MVGGVSDAEPIHDSNPDAVRTRAEATATHWESVWNRADVDAVSWFQERSDT
jgi:hypothetical protein